jgi:MFS family permease
MQQNDPFAAIRIPEFRNLIMGRLFFIFGLRMMTTLVGWWIFELTNAPIAIGMIGLSEFLPAFLLALYAGHVIDKSEKRRLLLRGVSLYLLATLMLLGLSLSYTKQHLSNYAIAVCICGVIFFTGIVRAFAGPVFNVILGNIVPKDKLQNATTWNQATFMSASVTGHATGGFLIAHLGNSGTLATISSLVAFSLITLWQLNKHAAIVQTGEKRTWDSVLEGLNFVFKTKEILGALSLDLFAVLFGGAVAMIPVYAKTVLNVGPEGFGLLNGASDIGSICVVVLLTLFPFKNGQGKKLLFAVAGFGLCIIVFAISKLYWLSFAVLMLSGMLDAVSVVIRGTIMQLKTPDNMRGRVMSVNSMFINSSNELGQFESGAMANLMGVKPSIIFGGCMTLLVVVVTWIKAPTLRKMEY